MIDRTAAGLREDYLARLDAALRDVPHGLAMEIRDGIAEELQGDDVERVRERLVRLGEPEGIAREALHADAANPPASATTSAARSPAPPVPLTRRTWFAVTAALVFGFGSFVIPVVGWVAGMALVVQSGRWRRWEKAWALLAPFGIAALLGVAMLVVRAIGAGSVSAGGDSQGPFFPAAFDIVWSGLALTFLVAVPAASLWLLLRLRTPRATAD